MRSTFMHDIDKFFFLSFLKIAKYRFFLELTTVLFKKKYIKISKIDLIIIKL